jgi:hypothetical protein
MKGTFAPVPPNAAQIVLRPVYTQSGEHAGEDLAIDLTPQK